MRVLLVDDHILFAKSLSIALCDNPEIEQFSSTKDIQDLEKQIATDKKVITFGEVMLRLTAPDFLRFSQTNCWSVFQIKK